MKIFADQSKGVEEDLRNTINVVGNFGNGCRGLQTGDLKNRPFGSA